MTSFEMLRDEVLERASAGESLGRINANVIEPSLLDDDEKAALWLVARNGVDHAAAGRQLRLAEQMATYRRAREFHPVGTD